VKRTFRFVSAGSKLRPAENETAQKMRQITQGRGFFPQTSQTMASAVLILAAPQHHPPIPSYLPTRRKRQFMVHRGVLVADVWRFLPYCDYGGDGRRVCFELIFVSELIFTRASSTLRPKNVILQEIMIIFISFKDADLLHYLLPDVFTQRRRVWGTMVAVERWPPCGLLYFSHFLCVGPPKVEVTHSGANKNTKFGKLLIDL
jgi:hypothetical protein